MIVTLPARLPLARAALSPVPAGAKSRGPFITTERSVQPQELSGQTAEYTGTTRGGQEVRMVGVVCNACADLPPNAGIQPTRTA